MNHEANHAINFLASMPSGYTTVTKNILRELLLETNGTILAHGRLYSITSKHLGAGVYEIRLKARNT